MSLTLSQRQYLQRALQARHEKYDPDAHLLWQRRDNSYQCHSNLHDTIAHPTRESLSYAAALLDSGDAELEPRALSIVRRVLELQDADPDSPWFGIWPKHIEEPLDKVPSVDRNWADFLGVQLLHIVQHHRDRLPPDVEADIETALRRAATAIRRRDVELGYTNIIIMGSYVTLAVAETYGDDDLKSYAMQRLKKFVEFTRYHGGFIEYNSPTYTFVALRDLARVRLHARTPEAKPLIEEIYRRAWQELATHFHAPSRQWAGPHSRSYRDLTTPEILGFIQHNTSERVDFGIDQPDIGSWLAPAPCPPDLEAHFAQLPDERTLVKTFNRDLPIVGTTFFAPDFALGSASGDNLWNQRRGLIAHWGAPEAPSFARLRFLHDDYDFGSALLWSAQNEGRVLAGIGFCTDGGDKHPGLDLVKNATIRARDLRLRWQLGGAAKATLIEAPADLGEVARIEAEGLQMQLAVPYARWGQNEARWETGRDETSAWLDVVLYDGPERAWKLDELEQALVGLALQITTGDEPMPPSHAIAQGECVCLDWGELQLRVPSRPAPMAQMRALAASALK